MFLDFKIACRSLLAEDIAAAAEDNELDVGATGENIEDDDATGEKGGITCVLIWCA